MRSLIVSAIAGAACLSCSGCASMRPQGDVNVLKVEVDRQIGVVKEFQANLYRRMSATTQPVEKAIEQQNQWMDRMFAILAGIAGLSYAGPRMIWFTIGRMLKWMTCGQQQERRRERILD